MPPRGFGRILRGARRGPRILRHILRPPRRIIRRLLFGSFVYLAIAGSRPYKLYPEEVERIETHSGKSTEDMTEENNNKSIPSLRIELKYVDLSENFVSTNPLEYLLHQYLLLTLHHSSVLLNNHKLKMLNIEFEQDHANIDSIDEILPLNLLYNYRKRTGQSQLYHQLTFRYNPSEEWT